MRGQQFEVITHEYPVLHEKSPLFAEAEAQGHLLPEGYERGPRPPGATHTIATASAISISRIPRRAPGGGQPHRALVDVGVAGLVAGRR